MNDKPKPPILRYRQIKQYFHVEIPHCQLAKWEESGVIHPFRPDENARAMYYTKELDQILNGPQAA